MSTATETKSGGVKLGAEPRKVAILAGLLVVAGGLFFYNLQSGTGDSGSTSQVRPAAPAAPVEGGVTARARTRPAHRTAETRDRRTLRIQSVDPRNGNIDPTLRLDLLARLQAVQPLQGGRSLFEMGSAPAASAPIPKVTIVPKQIPNANSIPAPAPVPPAFTIPLKYYGFAKSNSAGGANRGFFLDGDKILVASEGDLLNQRYLVVELTASSAKLEDTQQKQGQTLPLVPEARNEF